MNGYELADFVPYDAATWQSLYTQYLAQTWFVSLALGFGLFVCQVLLWRRAGDDSAPSLGPVLIGMAGCWAWLGWAFHGQWHQQLNWAAYWWAYAFLTQAALLAAGGIWVWIAGGWPLRRLSRVGVGLLLLPWLVPPLAGLFLGSRLPTAWEFVGAASDPTAWFTIMMVALPVASSGRAVITPFLRRLVLIIPLLSLAASSTAAWVTGALDLLITQLIAGLCIVARLMYSDR